MRLLQGFAGLPSLEGLEPRLLLSAEDGALLLPHPPRGDPGQLPPVEILYPVTGEQQPGVPTAPADFLFSYYNGIRQVSCGLVSSQAAICLQGGFHESDLDVLLAEGGPLAGYQKVRWVDEAIVLIENTGAGPSSGALGNILSGLPQVKWTSPVLLDEASGMQMFITNEVIVALKPGQNAGEFLSGPASRYEPRSLPASTRRFLLTVPGDWEDCFEAISQILLDPAVAYAEPNALTEVRPWTNDPLYGDQWNLSNTGQTGALSDADVDAPEAWASFEGSQDVVIAVLDDGVQLSHPDLAAHIFQNMAEINGTAGVDDDGNGYVDDFHGWDFIGSDNDPNPTTSGDVHGTAVAGVAAAVGGNEEGVAGIAQHARILPVKMMSGLIYPDDLADAIRYAGGIDDDGNTNWRGADIINCSWSYPDYAVVTDAFNDVATYGRGGLGVPIFVATGNSATGYVNYTLDPVEAGLTAGTYVAQWSYAKDPGDPQGGAGDNTVWLSNIVLPDAPEATATRVRFDAQGLPAGWATGGSVNWTVVDDPAHAYGTGRYEAKAGTIANSQSTILQSSQFVLNAGTTLSFEAWVSSEAGTTDIYYLSYPPDQDDGDWLFLRLLNLTTSQLFTYGIDAGVPGARRRGNGSGAVTTAVSYPASLESVIAVGACTDWAYRADYSQYGSALDLVAPSSGGFGYVTTTDRTGNDGYNAAGTGDGDPLADTNYTSRFGGTSAAAPLAAGIAALILSKNPGLTGEQVREAMVASADKIGGVTYTGGFNTYYGFGRVNAAGALAAISDAPTGVDLVAGSDTGTDDTDNLTRLDNSATGKKLEFDVLGTVSGATVTLYAGAREIGSDVATGTTTRITTNGTVDLTDGQNVITARQTAPDKLPSAGSTSLTVTVDTTPPTVVAFVRAGEDGVSWMLRPTELWQISLEFSEAVGVDQYAAPALYNMSASQAYEPDDPTLDYDTQTFIATWDYDGVTPAVGRYRVTVSAANVQDLAGNELDGDDDGTGGDDYVYGLATPEDDMIVPVGGDTNLDGIVNESDYLTIKYYFGPREEPNWCQGDFDLDSDVGLDDLLTLEKYYGAILTVGNAFPVANGESYSVANNGTLSIAGSALLANDTDEDDVELAAALIVPEGPGFPTHGTVQVDSYGVFHYVPEENFVGTDQFLYQVSDGRGGVSWTTVDITVYSSVAGRHIFYNNSYFDGDDSDANAQDDAAIATDKTALLPGGTATFDNYTNYSRGINGIMVDIAGLPGTLTASDFIFSVGNSNTPSTWTQLTAAPDIAIRAGAGTGGSDRVTLTWADNTIQEEWLQVTVLSDANGGHAGLAANDVFYFGNAIGEVGDSTTDAAVNALDISATRANQTTYMNPAGITNRYDGNRDHMVDSVDISIVRDNQTTYLTVLHLVSVPQ